MYNFINKYFLKTKNPHISVRVPFIVGLYYLIFVLATLEIKPPAIVAVPAAIAIAI